MALWKGRYGGDPAIICKTITSNGERHEIIGVVPDTLRDVGRSQISSVAGQQLFVPLRIDPARENRGNRTLRGRRSAAPWAVTFADCPL